MSIDSRYKGKFGKEVEALPPNAASKRAVKLVSFTTQYTPITEDYTSNRLVFTADAGQTINVILNDNVSPDIDGELQIVSAGNHLLQFTGGAGTTVTPTKNCLPITIGIGSLVSVTLENSLSDFIVGGSLQYVGELSSSRPVKFITAAAYTLESEDRGAWLRFNNTANTVVTVPPSIFVDKDEILGEVVTDIEVSFVAGSGGSVKKSVLKQNIYIQNSVIGGKFRSATELLIFGSLKPL